VERDRAEGQSADATWGSWVFGVELRYLLWGVVEILQVFPGIPLYSIAFPFDQVLEFSSEHPTVQDFFHNVLLFPIYEFRWRLRVPLVLVSPVT